MERAEIKAALAGLGLGLLCGVALGGIIGGGWYWSSHRQAASPSGLRMRLRSVPPVAQAVPDPPVNRSTLTPPDAVDAWKQYNPPPATTLATAPSIPSPYGALPTRRSALAAGRVGNTIITVGGYRRTPTYMLDVNEILDLSSREWDSAEPYPMRITAAAGAVVDDFFYVAGGGDGVRTRAEMFVFNPRLSPPGWEIRAPMPHPRSGAAAVAFSDDKIYFIGREAQGKDPYMVQVYDPANDAWEARTAPCEVGYYAAAVALADRIVVFGGDELTRANHHKDEVLVYYPAADRWERATPMPVARCGGAAAMWRGKIYVFGGQDNPPSGSSVYGAMARVDVYDPATDRWTRARDMAQPRLYHSAITVDDGILVLSGCDTNANPYDAAELYIP